jgi:regulator of protease activity HflC (stomatin/prohibitin superfamily)
MLRVVGAVLIVVAALVSVGFYAMQPNEAYVLTLFGSYVGTDRTTGLRWVLPWYGRKKISLRVRNVTSEMLKVNDKRGNPIEIAANIVWRVADSAQALFDVDDYIAFVNIQIETGLREVASHYAYDHAEEGEATLRADAEEVGAKLQADLQKRIAVAGVAIDEAHLMHLAYAPEIAGSMLKRQRPCSPPVAPSSPARSAWSRTRSTNWPIVASSRWTMSARRRWFPTSWLCCARIARPSPSSTPARCTASRGRRTHRRR